MSAAQNAAGISNRFRARMETGVFAILAEHEAPASSIAPSAAGEKLFLLDRAVEQAGSSAPMALAITDGCSFHGGHRAVEYACALPPERRNEHIYYLSGRNTPAGEVGELLGVCRSSGIENVVPVSGDYADGCSVWTESVRILRITREHGGDDGLFYAGCAVNPFQYRSDLLFAQLFKLVKKFNTGARFAVAQAGWDMRKLQALKWYLSYRNLEFPLVARLVLLTPEKLEKLENGELAGLSASPDFKAILRRELSFSAKQFESAQWRRLELQVAGCKLLGFSAVQIAGIDTPEKIALASSRLGAALREFPTFERWVESYRAYQARAELAPSADSFMLFDNLLSTRHFTPPAAFSRSASPIAALSGLDKLKFNLRRRLARSGGDAPLRFLMPGDGYGACVARCPKHLNNGICGGARPDGGCEAAPRLACVFLKQLALAEWRGELDRLEDEYVPSYDETAPGAELKK